MAGLESYVVEALRDIGLDAPSPEDPVHVKLVATLRRLGPGASFGQRMVGMRFDFNWALREAGSRFATAKTDYEHHVDKAKTRLMVADGYSGVKAEAVANSSDEAYRLLLEYRLAEQQERAMRKFLDTLENALDLHRTDRADQRAADQWHAEVGT